MKPYLLFIPVLFLLAACNSSTKKAAAPDNTNFGYVSSKVIEVTRSYLAAKLPHAVISTNSDGLLSIQSPELGFEVAPQGINLGQIDEDASLDAIVSFVVSPAGKPKYSCQLLMLNKDSLKVIREFKSELRVMQISNRIVWGEIPNHGPDTPLHGCNECKVTVKYKLSGDSLQRIATN